MKMQAEYGSKDTDVLINAQDYNKTGILLTFESGEKRVLDINRLFAIPDDDHLSDAIKLRWKEMYERGDFFKYEINNGDLVFGGWVEIFKEDLKKQTTELSIYRHFEQSNRLFVHYGSKHFDKDAFIEAKNWDGIRNKPYGGLWASPVDSENNWLNWCKENDYKEYEPDNCFYFRLDMPLNWMTIHSKKEWEKLPKQKKAIGDYTIKDYVCVDFEKLMKQGIDSAPVGVPIYALEMCFDNCDEFRECFPGYDCDSVIVLKDSLLIENYDARYTDNPVKLPDLKPVLFFKEIRKDVEVSCLLRSPDDKTYIYIEEPDRHYGFKTLTACISDGRLVELGGYTEKEALDLIKEIMPYKEELEQLHKANRIPLVH